MILNLLGLAALVFLTYLFFTLLLRSLRSRRWAVRILGGLTAGALTLVCAGAFVVALLGVWRVDAPRHAAVPALKIQSTPELIARGAVVAETCRPCHSLDGGPILNGGAGNQAPALWGLSLGVIHAPNLTPGGALKTWTDGEIIRAVRDGLTKDGTPLYHPAGSFRGMSDDDAVALVAYLRSQPALRHDQPRRAFNLLGWLAAGAGLAQTGAQASR